VGKTQNKPLFSVRKREKTVLNRVFFLPYVKVRVRTVLSARTHDQIPAEPFPVDAH
jgi:hypothetical protein